MSIISKIFSKAAGDTIKDVADIADNFVTTSKDKARFKEELTRVVMDNTTKLAEQQAQVLQTEMTGNWLQRSWRPIVMLCFAGIIIYRFFIAPVFQLQAIDMPDHFWSLLEIGLGGYVIGRSVEKISDRVTKNIDVQMLRKKDRRDYMKHSKQ